MTDRNKQGRYQQGHNLPGPGRPLLYPDAEGFQHAVDAYFQQLPESTPPTIAGLCLFLGFTDKDSFSDQASRGDAFSRTVAYARLRIEKFLEEALYDKSRHHSGVQFALSANYGWNPKTKVEHEGATPIARIELVAPDITDHLKKHPLTVESDNQRKEVGLLDGFNLISHNQ